MYGRALSDLHVKYQELLKKEDSKLIRQVLDFFEYRARVVKDGKVESFEQSVNLLLDDDGKRILELMDTFSKEIKDIFMRSEESIIHITNIAIKSRYFNKEESQIKSCVLEKQTISISKSRCSPV